MTSLPTCPQHRSTACLLQEPLSSMSRYLTQQNLRIALLFMLIQVTILLYYPFKSPKLQSDDHYVTEQYRYPRYNTTDHVLEDYADKISSFKSSSCINKMLSLPLSFTHIPKTAGTTIETLALQKANICWGMRMTKLIKHHRLLSFNICNRYKICKRPNQSRSVYYPSINSLPSLWHIPLRYIFNYIDELNSTPSWKWYFERKKYNVFCVVRNPITRMLSDFKYAVHWSSKWLNRKYKWDEQFGEEAEPMNPVWCTKDALNHWIEYTIKETLNSNYCFGDCHFVPQYDYVFDESGNQICDQILHFENVTHGFGELMKRYKLNHLVNITRGVKQLVAKRCDTLTMNDINNKSKSLIYKMYEKDFNTFNYTMY